MGYFYVVCAGVLWGVLGPVSRVALQEGLAPLEVAFWRAVIAAVLFGVHAGLRRRVRVARRDLPAVVGFGLVGVAFLYVAYFMAVREGGAALASVLLYTAPVWVAVIAALFLHERMGGRKAAALALAMAGVTGIALASGGGSGVRVTPAALGWGLASGLAYAVYYLFGKRFFQRYETSTLFLYALPVGALAMLPLVDFAPKSPRAWLALAFLAAVPTYGSYLFYGAGLKRIEATRAATVATVEPVVAAVAAYFAWGERWSPSGYLFAALVLVGVLLMVSEREPGAPHPEHS
jgi:DME family drug/metabolite transporter